jgi:protein ImuB
MRWACLLFPHFAVDGVLRRRPASDQAVILVTGPAHRRVVAAVNTQAASAGVRVGIAVQAAQAMTTAADWVEFDAAQIEHDRQLLAAWAYGFSSQVSLSFADAVVLEVGASMVLFGPWEEFERRLRTELDDLGFRHRVVVAPNAWAAHALAQVSDGLGVGDGQLANALARLPVESSGLDAASAGAFSRMGLRRLGQVMALPRDTIARRFPPSVLHQLDALRGRPLPLPFYQPANVFHRRIEFDHEIELTTGLLFPLRRLLSDLAAFVRARDGGIQNLTIIFEHDRFPPTQMDVGLLAPERDPNRLLDLARNRLEHTGVNGPVRAVRVLAEDLPSFVPPSADLFEQRAQGALSFDQLRERLRARLGAPSVHGIATDFDHRPERAWRIEDERNEPNGTLSDRRPGWLLERPVPLRGPAHILYGPERVESGWWDEDDVRRDYYIVEMASGQIAWAYTNAGDTNGFMLHGFFA